MRPKADILAEVREAAAAGRREVQLLGQIVNHYQAPDDPACDFTGLLEAVHEVRRRRADPLREPASAARRRRGSSTRCARLPKVCRHLHLPVQSGSTRVLAGDAAALHARELPRSGRAHPRPAAGGRALDRYDRRVPRRDRRGLRGHAVADRGGRLPQHVLVQVLAAAEHAGRRSGRRRRCAEAEKTRGSWRCRRCSATSSRGSTPAGRRATVEVLVDAASRRRDTELSGRTTRQRGGQPAGAGGVDRPDGARCGWSGPARTACGARRRARPGSLTAPRVAPRL